MKPLESQMLLVGAVGVLHTLVPDHWLPIAVLAWQRGWSKVETARTAAQAGSGHVVSTLAIAVVVWIPAHDRVSGKNRVLNLKASRLRVQESPDQRNRTAN